MAKQRAATPACQVHLVTGKGGVGKTLVAASLARLWARSGQRVLLAELNSGDQLAGRLGVKPTAGEMREVLEHLHLVNIEPERAMREYAMMRIKLRSLYRLVFENRLVRGFLGAIPSLAELVMLGKLAYHSIEQEDGRPRFDKIVIDAPATGHAVSLLATPGIVLDAVKEGPLAEAVRLSVDMLRDQDRTRIHLVTIPEELPVNETLELRDLLVERHFALGWLLFNHHQEAPCHLVFPELPPELPPELQHAHAVLRDYATLAEAAHGQLARLTKAWRRPDFCLPTMVANPDASIVDQAVSLMEEVLNDERACPQ